MVERYWQEKNILGENPVSVHFVYHKSSHGLEKARTRVSAVRGSRLTAWAMARPRKNEGQGHTAVPSRDSCKRSTTVAVCSCSLFWRESNAYPSRVSLCLRYIHYYRLCVYNGTIIDLYNNTQYTHGFRQYRPCAAECAGSRLVSNYDVTKPLERS
jgi:hypothetical protein